MISYIIESLSGSVEALNLLQKIYPLCEQKEAEDKTIIVSYTGKGNFQTAFDIDNYNGIGYFRKTADTTITKKGNEFKACSDLQGVKYSLRFVASIMRDQLPNDCAFSDDELGWMIAKELTGTTGALKTAMGASMLYIQATKISTDRKQILADEVPGNDISDINYSLSLVAVDFDIDIDIEKKCIASICDSYYTVPVGAECDYLSEAIDTSLGLVTTSFRNIRIDGIDYSFPDGTVGFSPIEQVVTLLQGLLEGLGILAEVKYFLSGNDLTIQIAGTTSVINSYSVLVVGEPELRTYLFTQSNCS